MILPIPNVEHADFKVSTFSSQLAIEYILNVLYSCIFSRNFDKNYTSQKIHLLRYLNFKQKNSTDDQYCFSNQEDRIRTCDPLVPNQVLYQAELLPGYEVKVIKKTIELKETHVHLFKT